MRRFLSLALSALLLLGAGGRAQAAPPNGTLTAAIYNYKTDKYGPAQELPLVDLRLNGESISGEMPGVIYQSRTLAPLRLLAEGLGAEVEWMPDSAQVLITRDKEMVLLTLGSATANVNGEPQELPDGVPATMVSYKGQGYTMVPLRFFSQSLGCRVGWEQTSYTAKIYESDYIADLLEPLDAPVDANCYTIALDAGHGGSASGAAYEETMEKDLTLSMTQKVQELLSALGYNTVMTREGDEYVDLYDRARIANDANADIFVSVHCNAADKHPDFEGLYVYHYPWSWSGMTLAQSIQTPACTFTGAVDRGIDSANFVVVRETRMPAVLVETGFMTCSEELARLKDEDYQTRMAQGIVQGIIQYLNAQGGT